MADHSYPLNLDPQTQARIRFHCYKAQPINVSDYQGLQKGFSDVLAYNKGRFLNAIRAGINLDNKTVADETATEVDAEEEANNRENDLKISATEKLVNSLQGFKYKLDTNSPMINMYVPLSLTFNDNIIYDNVNLGAAGAAFGRALQEGTGLIGSIGSGLFDGFNTAGDVLMGGVGQFGEGAGARLALQRTVALAANRLSPNIANTATLALQTSVNPNTRGMFRGVALREFTFTFSMIPRSASEAREAQKIIKFFRQRMYPSTFNPFDDESPIPIGYEFPDLFRISFKIGNTDIKVPKIHLAYLRNCSINYNPTGSSFHDDGQPNEMTMTLNFLEHKTISREDISLSGAEGKEGRIAIHHELYGNEIAADGY